MKGNVDEYAIDYFKKNGFERKICKKCGNPFWTINHSKTTCGEAPCEPYDFLINPIMKKYSSLDDLRKTYLTYFEKNGHTIIDPYPVVARWRDDIYLTIASIAVFQPHITSGEADPPANPLVISQPCIRLVDIDDVGKSMKHLTIFEMAAHHAFNYPNKEIYWKDKTVELCHNFLTEIMNVDPMNITYKESWWEGGGNAGPCLEVCVGGLEIATLVFMMYKVIDDKYELMPMRIVDTGYGLERILWESQSKPTIFHSIYDEILNDVLSKSDIEDKSEMLREYVYKSSMGDRQDYKTYGEYLNIIQGVFALLDYTKCLTFMLADGLVPSNSGGGYLARLLIRRALRLINTTKINLSLKDLIKLQIRKWGKTYRHIAEMEEEIYDMLNEEEEKYIATMKRGERIIQNIINEVKRKGANTIPSSKLIELYDSQGIPPEMVQEVAKKSDIKVEVPENFYSEVVKRHLKACGSGEKKELKISIEKYPPTKRIYYDDPYQFEFEAKVIGIEGNKIILDSTAFYPEGGGQPYDQGVITWNGGNAKIINVQKVGDVILHEVEGDKPPLGEIIHGFIDVERRLALMRSHTATHILVAALMKVLGKHIWQAGAQKDVYKNRLDVTHHKQLSDEEIEKVEEIANTYVLKNVDVKVYEMPRAEAERKYGVRIYQGGVVPGRNVRIVEIEGINVQACGGLHVKRTGEVGLIKILKCNKIQDGVLRLEFTCGLSSLKHIQNKEKLIKEATKILNTQEEHLIKNIEKLKGENEKVKLEYRQLWKKHIQEIILKNIIPNPIVCDHTKIFITKFNDLTKEQMIEIGGEILKMEKEAMVIILNMNANLINYVVMMNEDLVDRGLNASIIAERISKILEGKGGGDKTIAQGYGKRIDRIAMIEEEVKKYIKELQKT
ncbi:MAG: alanine--tRNA ligase [archaeon YNP-LCB-003-016]|uniref:alanine--tRNA ligase n=1 Tax=Candidatus Culexarchaeum yellowstonense TaxID=2928963 RepID=UPI0026F355AC|nr:alanine--tRNA ligase [Candidatus Culexarchaeum yellowstonense]MCR6690829.1 alanine--tRNA ligase [Candidatus Culexarchaeum yellowstonense]